MPVQALALIRALTWLPALALGEQLACWAQACMSGRASCLSGTCQALLSRETGTLGKWQVT